MGIYLPDYAAKDLGALHRSSHHLYWKGRLTLPNRHPWIVQKYPGET